MIQKKVEDMTLQEQAEAILKEAAKKGISTNFYFVSTLKRYQVQMRILSDLEKEIAASGADEKNYKAIAAYNQTASAANGVVKTLIDITRKVIPSQTDKSVDIFRKYSCERSSETV